MNKREDRAAVFMLAKKMKVERKGKAYPSQPSASSLSSSKSSYKDPDSVLKLLPVTILALALSLPNQDREVLAYLIARWDSSPNRDFIHQVIEAFEEHLVQKIESSKKQSRGRKKAPKTECEVMIMQEHLESGEIEENEVVYEEEMVSEEVTSDLEMEVVAGHASGYDDSNQKGLSRKVLPDAMGLLISRLWSNLWSPGM
ncbi:hypothetical protein OIU84_007234 [Salix udensis]|uniref:Uncharacterized protein n=1 Tax=Salix udensis TaxID=889485 RepID=A0AAD6JUB3_9ROSI|nr:hypothetical protein OIU84_007234 [Salix udensis]